MCHQSLRTKTSSREAEYEWHREYLTACATMSASCGPHTVFLEGWQTAWDSVEKHARKPHGRHLVVGAGLGSLCLFSLHLAGASQCIGLNDMCQVSSEAARLLASMSTSKKPNFDCGALNSETDRIALTGADVVWIIDGHVSAEQQARTESDLASMLSAEASVVVFIGSQLLERLRGRGDMNRVHTRESRHVCPSACVVCARVVLL